MYLSEYSNCIKKWPRTPTIGVFQTFPAGPNKGQQDNNPFYMKPMEGSLTPYDVSNSDDTPRTKQSSNSLSLAYPMLRKG
jgi:hypothetical protein